LSVFVCYCSKGGKNKKKLPLPSLQLGTAVNKKKGCITRQLTFLPVAQKKEQPFVNSWLLGVMSIPTLERGKGEEAWANSCIPSDKAFKRWGLE